MIGRVIGTYRITEKLGEGGMGEVYRAVDQMIEREAAVKVLRPEYGQNPDFNQRFRAEAVALARLSHPAIATLYAFFREGEESFMVMEYVPGETLEHRILRGGALEWQQAVLILLQALDGVRHAHEMGILHRDLKPANIMITPEGRVKVTDFGIARLVNSVKLTREASLVGTLEYIAPERALGQPADARSDIYSLGVVFYEMLTGRLPFHADTDFALMRAQVEEVPKIPSELGIRIPQPIEQALMRALAKNPDYRYPDASTFAAQFREAVRSTGMPLGPMRPAASPAPREPTARIRPSKTIWAAAAGAALIAAAAFGVAAARHSWKPEPKLVSRQEAPGASSPAASPTVELQPIAPVVSIPAASPEPALAEPSRPVPNRNAVMAVLEQTDGPVAAGSSGSHPLHYAGVLKAVRLGGAPAAPWIINVVHQRGVNFRLTPSQIIDLHAAGATDALIHELPSAYREMPAAVAEAPIAAPISATARPAAPVEPEPAPPPVSAAARPSPLRRLADVHKIIVQSKQTEFDSYLSRALQAELGGRVEIVLSAAAADAVMRIEVEDDTSGRIVGTASRVLGMKGKHKALVQLVERRQGHVLWSIEAGDRQAVFGAFGDGARRLASRVAKQFKKDWEK